MLHRFESECSLKSVSTLLCSGFVSGDPMLSQESFYMIPICDNFGLPVMKHL